eukprot:XP_004918167.1 PREDICTED: uncharacterized protein LOC101733131 [Xenopus tropicalis]
MCPWKNLVGILFGVSLCLPRALSSGRFIRTPLNKDLTDQDIRKEVEKALEQMDKPTFPGWHPDGVKQAVPRLHLGLVEMWLHLRNVKQEQNEMFRRTKRIIRRTSASLQEVGQKVSELSDHLPPRMEIIEQQVARIQGKEESTERSPQPGSANGTQLCKTANPMPLHLNQTNTTCPEGQRPDRNTGCKTQCAGSKRDKMDLHKLTRKVATLSELLNGHNELLVELYERLTALEILQIPQGGGIPPT